MIVSQRMLKINRFWLFQGDLLTPPDQVRKEKKMLRQQKKTIRGRDESDDSDIEFSD